MEEEKKFEAVDGDIEADQRQYVLPLPPALAARALRSFSQEDLKKQQPPSRLKLHLFLILAQVGFAGYEVLLRRTVVREETSILVFSLYQNCVGFVVLRLFATLLEKKTKPVLNFTALVATFLLGVFGVSISELCYLKGLKYTTPTFASAMRNVIPVFTFILALIFRMEKVDIERVHGVVKLIGSMLLICGWMLLLAFQGNSLVKSHFSFLPHGGAVEMAPKAAKHSINLGLAHFQLDSQQYGIVFLVISCLSSSVFLILQSFIMEKYTGPVSFASFAFFFGVIQVGLVAASRVHKRSAWSIFGAADLISLAYAGIVGSAAFGIQSWGVKQGGPVIVSAYQPLETIVTIVLSFFLLKWNLYLGSLIGGGIMLTGLYLMVWGIEREQSFDSLCVVHDFQGMPTSNAARLSVESSATKSPVETMELEASDERSRPWYSRVRASNREVEQEHEFRVEPNSTSVFQQPLFEDGERKVSFSRQTSPQASPIVSEQQKPRSSESSNEVASTKSKFSRWNSVRTVTSVRSVPSRVSNGSMLSSLTSAGPSRANSLRSAVSRLASGVSNLTTGSTSDSDRRSSHSSTSSD